MELTFGHVDILGSDLDRPIAYYRSVMSCRASEKLAWQRNGFHVEYVIMFNGSTRFILVKPISGVLKDMIGSKGEGTIYRLAYTVPDVGAAFDELRAKGVMPVDERGNPLPFEELTAPQGSRFLWLPKAFGDLSIELAEAAGFEARLRALSDRAS